MKIYWIKAQAPRRVLALVKHLRIEVDLIHIDAKAGGLKAPDYAALNPNKKAPTLVDGDFVLWESSAIMAYLCIKAASDMWPAGDPAEQVEVLRWLSWNDCHWAPAVGPFYFEHIVKATFNLGLPDREALRSRVPELMKYGKILNGHLEGRSFVTCGRLTIADFQLASMATDWRQAEIPFQDFPNIREWIERLMQMPAWANPWPAR
jgi:glutathione S-transferase